MATRTKKAEPKDPWMVGFRFNGYKDVTPDDFRLDAEKGVRRKGKNPDGSWKYEDMAPTGTVKIDLTDGIPDYCTLPPVKTWAEGKWLSDMNDGFEPNIGKKERWECWVVDGEGTPMNYTHRIYLLPPSLTANENPAHPAMWSKVLKDRKTTSYNYTPKAPSLPTRLRIRCQGCGHWFSENDMKDHIVSACPTSQGGSTEWIIPCDCCTDLDLMAVCKPGFPRPKKEKLDEALKDEAHSVKVT